jgi:hypothetical protein
MKIKRRNSFSATNASQNEAKLAYIKLNSQTPGSLSVMAATIPTM